jgi:hypothetical protein
LFRKPGFVSFAVAVLTCVLSIVSPSRVQAQTRSPIITQGIDESKLVTLKGNTRPEANPGNDRGPVLNNLPIEHMLLQLRRSPEQEQEQPQLRSGRELHGRELASVCALRTRLGQHSKSGNHSDCGCEHGGRPGRAEHFRLPQWDLSDLEHIGTRADQRHHDRRG